MRDFQAGHGNSGIASAILGELFRLLIIMTERMPKQESFRC
ncbi:hypothetical protein AOX55_00001204 [Sinorhizobium fredii CCBAU 25509]|nr:hypothetical protein AOX55_00001204 [Sinorhizobium fredii CCBAU 25509]